MFLMDVLKFNQKINRLISNKMSGIYLKVTTELRNNFLQFSNLFKNESNMDV